MSRHGFVALANLLMSLVLLQSHLYVLPFYSNFGPDVISHIELVVLHFVSPSTQVHDEPHITSVQLQSQEVVGGGAAHALMTIDRRAHEENETRWLTCLNEGRHLWKKRTLMVSKKNLGRYVL